MFFLLSTPTFPMCSFRISHHFVQVEPRINVFFTMPVKGVLATGPPLQACNAKTIQILQLLISTFFPVPFQ